MIPPHLCSSLPDVILFPVTEVFSFYGFIQSHLQFLPKVFKL